MVSGVSCNIDMSTNATILPIFDISQPNFTELPCFMKEKYNLGPSILQDLSISGKELCIMDRLINDKEPCFKKQLYFQEKSSIDQELCLMKETQEQSPLPEQPFVKENSVSMPVEDIAFPLDLRSGLKKHLENSGNEENTVQHDNYSSPQQPQAMETENHAIEVELNVATTPMIHVHASEANFNAANLQENNSSMPQLEAESELETLNAATTAIRHARQVLSRNDDFVQWRMLIRNLAVIRIILQLVPDNIPLKYLLVIIPKDKVILDVVAKAREQYLPPKRDTIATDEILMSWKFVYHLFMNNITTRCITKLIVNLNVIIESYDQLSLNGCLYDNHFCSTVRNSEFLDRILKDDDDDVFTPENYMYKFDVWVNDLPRFEEPCDLSTSNWLDQYYANYHDISKNEWYEENNPAALVRWNRILREYDDLNNLEDTRVALDSTLMFMIKRENLKRFYMLVAYSNPYSNIIRSYPYLLIYY